MNHTLIIVIAAIVLFVLIKKLITNNNQKKMAELLKSESNTLIVDVRSKEEFRGGHIEKSINIPLDRISGEVEKLRKYGNIIIVCASGMRSAQAKSILSSKGLKNVFNGGGWQSFNAKI
jgi:rhodanese-related sulfurtransferase